MNRAISVSLAVVLLLTLAGGAQAALVIDHFFDPVGGQQVAVTGVGTNGPNTVTGLLALGGSRTMFVEVTSGTNPSQLFSNPLGPHALSLNTGSGNVGYATVLWDANGTGLGSVDFTLGGVVTYLQATIPLSDVGLGFKVDLTDSSANTASYSVSLPAGVSYVYALLTSFTNAGSVDFTDIDSVLLTLSGPASQDATIDLLEITTTPIPEPGTLLLLGLGGLGLVVHRRRRRRAA